MATVFVLTEPPDTHVLAYYALSAYTVAVSELEPDLAKRLPQYPQLPATLLGRLAVDQQHRGKGWGELMLMDALQRSLAASVQVASLAVVAEALDEQAARFYAKYGFQPVQESPLKLYLPMKTVERLF
ncbi:MAG: GNAT family N-acetyltransferase [Cyanobacteriota bacterium]